MKNKNKGYTLIEILVVLAIATILCGLIISSCDKYSHSEDDVIRILEQNGYRNITIDRSFHGMKRGDTFKYDFKAENANGVLIQGAVTGDNYTGWTVRQY